MWLREHPETDPSSRRGLQPPKTCKEGDGKKVFGHGWCQTHYLRNRTHGDPHIKTRRAAGELVALVHQAATTATDDCVVITGHKIRPRVTFNGVQMNASRAAWIIAHGDPGPLHVLHTCNGGSGDNGCVNPQHLYIDSNAQNRRDMANSDRSHHGSKHHGAKLDEDKVREIRARWVNGERNKTWLAKDYGVSVATIFRVVNGILWTRVSA